MPEVVIIMGVSGCGKTTIARALAERIGRPFLDADDFHPPRNVERMKRGEPLNDAHREPWLDALRHELLRRLHAAEPRPVAVLACSALRRSHRERLTTGLHGRFVHLVIDPPTASRRLRERSDHYFGPSLVSSQFDALEPPDDALAIDATRPIPQIVQTVAADLSR